MCFIGQLAFVIFANDGGIFCCPAVLIILALILYGYYSNHNKAMQALDDARQAYYSSLEQLKRYPTNADLRQRTLGLGRAYSAMTRERKNVTIYDEMALSNDINAACAGAPMVAFQQMQQQQQQQQYYQQQQQAQQAQQQSQQATSSLSTEQRLTKLKDLHDKGMISNDEYAERRKKIIDEV
jgi:hypothetical protein